MKTLKLGIALLLLIMLSISCKTNTDSTEKHTAVSTPIKKWSPDDKRQIPALNAKRGLLSNTEKATPGYVLFHPTAGTSTYLADLDGNIVHEWKSELLSMITYLQEDGSIIRHERDPDFPTFAAGGQSGRIREYTWDGEMTWDFEYATEDHLTHHDIAVLPNGNVLAIAYEVKSRDEAIQAGRKPDWTPGAGLWPDVIIEIEPTRPSGGNIVWEWHMWDHLVQDIDPTLDNYGKLIDHPRKININSGHPNPPVTEEQVKQMIAQDMTTANATVDNQGSDITHTNGINYNAELDQIVLSVPGFNEVFIIDHSTTTEEASGSTGGRWGHGGDLLYRWGNPANYGRGGHEDQKLFFQHDVRWIPEGFPGATNLMVFNNDVMHPKSKFPNAFAAFGAVQDINISLSDLTNYSQVLEFDPPVDETGAYILPEGGVFGPEEPSWVYMPVDTFSFYAPFVSSAHRMENGNTFVNSGPQGRIMEVTPEKEIVWEYWNPYNQQYRLPDGTSAMPVGPFLYAQFRVTHVSANHPALAGKQLEPINPQPSAFTPPPPPPPAPSDN